MGCGEAAQFLCKRCMVKGYHKGLKQSQGEKLSPPTSFGAPHHVFVNVGINVWTQGCKKRSSNGDPVKGTICNSTYCSEVNEKLMLKSMQCICYGLARRVAQRVLDAPTPWVLQLATEQVNHGTVLQTPLLRPCVDLTGFRAGSQR